MPESSPLTHRVIFWMALIILIGTACRFYRLDAQSFWNDEGNSARIAERPIFLIIEGAAGDIHPPGYYLLLSGWRALAGPSELSLRTLSALASVLTVAVVFALGARLFDQRTGLAAAGLVAINPFQVYYAQEARMYAVLALLGAASLLLTADVLTLPGTMQAGRFRPRRAAWLIAGYITLNALGLYTHYSFPLILIAETLVFFMWLTPRSRKGHGLLVWVLLQAGVLLLFLPWLPHAIRQLSGWSVGGSAADPVGIEAALVTLAYGPTLPVATGLSGLVCLLMIASVGLFPPVDPAAERHYLRFRERSGLVAACLLVPLAAMFLMGLATQPFLKFLLPAGLALNLLVARGLVMGYEITVIRTGTPAGPANVWLRLSVLLVAGIGLAPIFPALVNLSSNPAYARDDYRAIAQLIEDEAPDDVAIVLNAPNQWEVFTYYYPETERVFPLPDTDTLTTIERLLTGNRRIYALYWGDSQRDPERIVETALEARAFPVQAEWYGGVRLVTYAVFGGYAHEMETPLSAAFGQQPTIRLEGYTLRHPEPLRQGDALGLTLFWRADTPPRSNLKVFVHLVGPDKVLRAQHDSEPANGLRPTTTWLAGELIDDNHGLVIPPGSPPGAYGLVVGLYTYEGDRLPVTGSGGDSADSIVLETLTVE